VADVEGDESSPVTAVKGAAKRSGNKSGGGGLTSSKKQQQRPQDEDKKRQLESGLCYAHYQYGTQAWPGRCKQP
jgi:hypothetical protein